MTDDNIQRSLGSIESTLEHQGEHIKGIHAKVNDMHANGCMVGERVQKDIAAIKTGMSTTKKPTTFSLGPLKLTGFDGRDIVRVMMLICLMYLIAARHGWVESFGKWMGITPPEPPAALTVGTHPTTP